MDSNINIANWHTMDNLPYHRNIKDGSMSNIKLSSWDIIAIHIKRAFGWTVNRLAENYKVTTRTIYRALKK
jgi:hypothetical protein